MSAILEVKNLSKKFQSLTAVDNISFSVKRGVCFGLLGPNGAGKTTTIEMLEGILPPSQGEILFEGRPLNSDYHQQVGIQFQNTAIQDFLTVKETLQMFSRFYDKSLSVKNLIELCALESIIDRDTRKLSGGQRQRLLLALAILNDPKLIFLDEPTTGLDPQARRNFWELINGIKQQNKTILLTTHYMDEAESLCDEILVMDQGKIIEQGAPKALLARYFDGVIISLPAALEKEVSPPGKDFFRVNNRIEVVTAKVEATIRALLEAHIPLDDMQIRSPNLEDLFIKLTGHQLRS